MSLQDDIFDVAAYAENTEAEEAFDRIIKSHNRLERFADDIIKQLKAIEAGEFWLQSIRRGDWKDLLK